MEITRGVLWIHSANTALRPHLEWAIGGVIGEPVALEWTPQAAEARSWRTEYLWQGTPGTGGKLAAALRRCDRARFEVTEDAGIAAEGKRWAYTPRLGVFHAITGPHGDILVPEERLKQAILADAIGRTSLVEAIQTLMGQPWDDELEAFRFAGDGAPVRWLNCAG